MPDQAFLLDPTVLARSRGWIRIDAAGIADADRVSLAPGSVLVRCAGPPFPRFGVDALVEAIGSPSDIDAHPRAENAARVSMPDAVVLPGLVNAHTHLDLTHIGPQPHDPRAGFVEWVRMVRQGRRTDDASIAESVRRGIELSLAGGTVAIGDIAGSPGGRCTLAPLRALRDSPLHGVCFTEVIGIGPTERDARDRIDALLDAHADELRGDTAPGGMRIRFGLSPHAPNTVGLELYRHLASLAREHQLPLATHLAETLEERRFVADASGPQRDLLDSLGLWDDVLLHEVGRGRHPIEHLRDVLRLTPCLAAHVNDLNDLEPDKADRLINILAETGTRVVYCPRAADYFGAPGRLGPHRYRQLLDAGVPVCLGTDSIVSLPPSATMRDSQTLSVLEEMRLLHRRDGTDPRLLLAMGTTIAAGWLGLDPDRFRLAPGSRPLGMVAVRTGADLSDPMEGVARNQGGSLLLFCGK